MFPIASKIHCGFFKIFEKARCARFQRNPDVFTSSEKLKTYMNEPVNSRGTRNFNILHRYGTPWTLYRGRLSTAKIQKSVPTLIYYNNKATLEFFSKRANS